MSIPENHIIDYSWFFYYHDGLLLANSGFEDFTRVKVYVAYFTINHSYIFICWCSVIITMLLKSGTHSSLAGQ